MGHKLTLNVGMSLLTIGLNYRGHLWGNEQKLSELGKTDKPLDSWVLLGGLSILPQDSPLGRSHPLCHFRLCGLME